MFVDLFVSLFSSYSGTVEKEDLADLEYIRDEPYLRQVLANLDSDTDAKLTFEDFVRNAGMFSKGAPLEPKLRFIFSVFDYDFDDELSVSEVQQMCKVIFPEEDATEKAKTLIEEVNREADEVSPDSIPYAAFEVYMKRQPNIVQLLSIDFAKD